MVEKMTITVPCPNTNDIGSRKIGVTLFLMDSIPITGNKIINEKAKNIIQIFVMVPAIPSTNVFGFSNMSSVCKEKMSNTINATATPEKNKGTDLSIIFENLSLF